jgi:predicted ATPase
MLDRIKIQGFKSIRDLDLELKDINLIVGANGAGKSNLISFFKLVNNIYEQRLQEFSLRSGVDNLLHFGRRVTDEINGHLKFGANAYSFQLLPNDNGGLFIGEEKSIYLPAINNTSFYSSNRQESGIIDSETTRDRFLRHHLESYKIYHFHDTSGSAPLRTPAQIDDNRVLKEDGDNLAAYLYLLNQKWPKSFKRIENTFQSIAPFFEKFNLEPNRLDSTRINLVWNEKNHPEAYFDERHLSDGSLRFIALTTLLLQPELPSIIIIDEPELGLHPVAISKLAGLMKSAAQKGCQIIVSTQSVGLLNNFQPEHIVTADKKNGQSSFARLVTKDLGHWLEDYTIGELWTKSVINGQPR